MRTSMAFAAVAALLVAACLAPVEARTLSAIFGTAATGACVVTKAPSSKPVIVKISPGPKDDQGFWTWRPPNPYAKSGKTPCIETLEYQIVPGTTAGNTWLTAAVGNTEINAPSEIFTAFNSGTAKAKFTIFMRWTNSFGVGKSSKSTVTLEPDNSS